MKFADKEGKKTSGAVFRLAYFFFFLIWEAEMVAVKIGPKQANKLRTSWGNPISG